MVRLSTATPARGVAPLTPKVVLKSGPQVSETRRARIAGPRRSSLQSTGLGAPRQISFAPLFMGCRSIPRLLQRNGSMVPGLILQSRMHTVYQLSDIPPTLACRTYRFLATEPGSGVLKPDRTTPSQTSTPLPPRPTPGRVRTGQSGRLRPSRRLQASFAQAVRALAFSHWFPLRLFRRRGAAL